MARFLQVLLAVIVLTLFLPNSSQAADIPPAKSEAKIPAPAAKGINQANTAKENKGISSQQSSFRKPSQADVFYNGPLSAPDKSEETESNNGLAKNKGQNAVLKLSSPTPHLLFLCFGL